MKPKTMILMVVAVACGLGASYMTSKLLADRRAEAPPEEQVPVLMAKVRVPGWVVIKEPQKYFEVKMLPESAVSKKSLKSFEDVKNQRLNKPLDAERVAMQDDLLNKDQKSLIDNLVPGQRAIAVKVNPESVAGGFVLQGARVDVICTTKNSDSTSKIVLQGMLVLAVDMQDKRNPDQTSILPQTVTLAATPEEATRLALASSLGELRLLPKSPLDTRRVNVVTARASDLDKPFVQTDINDKGDSALNPPVKTTPLASLTEEKGATPEPVAPVAPVEKPRKKHVMTIINGASKEKAIFVEGDSEDDDVPSTPKKETSSDEKAEGKAKPATPEKTPGKSKGTGR
jgi:pilus assembly protein CpaB